jgi:hypothetical protein
MFNEQSMQLFRPKGKSWKLCPERFILKYILLTFFHLFSSFSVPQQLNGFVCGVFVCRCAWYVSKSLYSNNICRSTLGETTVEDCNYLEQVIKFYDLVVNFLRL